MAVQDDLAGALSAIAAATNTLNTIGAQATGAISAVTKAYNDRIASLRTLFYVNAITGSDAAAGTSAAPLRSISEAVRRTPYGGFCRVELRSAYTFTFAENLTLDKVDLTVIGDGVTRFPVTFERRVKDNITPAVREAAAIKFLRGGCINFCFIELVAPALDSFSQYQDYGSGCLFTSVQLAYGVSSISFLLCNINLPTTPFGSLLQSLTQVSFIVEQCTLNGPVTSLNGRVVFGRTDSAGVAASTVSGLMTNLVTV